MIGLWNTGRFAIVMVAVTFARQAPAFAGPAKAPKPTDPSISVVAHVPLDATVTDQIFVREGPKNSILLYAVQESGRAISVVDVTTPARASIVRRLDAEPQGLGGRLVTVGINTMAVESDGVPPTPPAATKTVRFLDLSNPAEPRVALQDQHVSAYILDASRSLIYLVNNDGLWIIRHVEPMDWKTKAWWDFATTP